MLRKMTIPALTLSVLLLAACQAAVSIQPNPSPTAAPTASPTAQPSTSPTPAPSATPGWVQATIRPTAETNDAVLAEVRKLETEGQVSNVVVLESFPVQIQLSGSAAVVARLQDMASGAQTLAITSLSQRSSNLQTAGTRTITSAETFAELWRQHTGAMDAPPTVDFGQQTVLAVFAGEKPTGGYSAVITSVKLLDKTMTVHYRVNEPAPGTIVTQMITYPAHLVSVPVSQAKGDFTQVNYVQEP